MNYNNPLKRYNTKYWENFFIGYSGEEGLLKTEDGPELPCKFEAGQLDNGKIILTCTCSIYDLNIQKYFPELNLSNPAPSEIKFFLAWSIYSPNSIFQQLEKIRSFYGITSDGFNIAGKISRYINIDNDSLRDQAPEVKLKFSMTELTIHSDVNEDIYSVIFGISNFMFTGQSLILDIDGQRLEIMKINGYEDISTFIKICKATHITCEVKVEVHKKADIETAKIIVTDLCDIMSIALGTRVQWIYYYACNSIGKKVLWNHESRVTKPYFSNKIINFNDPRILENYIEISYTSLANKSNLLRSYEGTAKPLINAYLDAKSENDYLEGRGIKLVVVMEMLKDSFIRSKPVTQNIIKEEYFSRKKSSIKSALSEAIEQSVNEENKEKNEQEKVNIKKEIKEKMFAKISELNRISFKEILRNLCDDISLQIDPDELQSIVDSRNKLIHEGKFLCQSDNIKNKYKDIEKYPQFEDPVHEYFFLVNFIDKCFLKILSYKGPYINWKNIDEMIEEELM